ncbi:MAG: hypothetical protein AB7F23_02080 [Phycisphaerae bacterium]
MPGVAVYLVLPSLTALIAASLIISGVSKSGSPAAKLTTSTPLAISSLARVATAIVAEPGTDRALRLVLAIYSSAIIILFG